MTAYITTLLPTWGPVIAAVFGTIIMIVAAIGKISSAISIFKKDSTKEMATLATQVKDQATNNARLAADNEALMKKNEELTAKIDSLLKSDQFLAHREKADLNEFKQLAAKLSRLYSDIE